MLRFRVICLEFGLYSRSYELISFHVWSNEMKADLSNNYICTNVNYCLDKGHMDHVQF